MLEWELEFTTDSRVVGSVPLQKPLAFSFPCCHCFLNSLPSLQCLASALDASRTSRTRNMSELVHFFAFGLSVSISYFAIWLWMLWFLHFATSLSQVLLQAFEPSTILLLQILTGLGKGKDIKMSLEMKEPGSACQTRTFLAASISSCVNLVEFLYPYISSIPFMGNRSRCNCVISTCSWLSSPFKQVMILYHAGP